MSYEEVFESLLCTIEAKRVTGMRLSVHFTSAVCLEVSLLTSPFRFISRARPNVRGEFTTKTALSDR